MEDPHLQAGPPSKLLGEVGQVVLEHLLPAHAEQVDVAALMVQDGHQANTVTEVNMKNPPLLKF